MACDKIGHVHEWPTSGTLVVQRCEIKCNFCGDGKRFKYAWFLRRHIRAMHIAKGPYKSLTVSEDWGDAHASAHKQKKNRQRRKKMATPKYAVQPLHAEQLAQGYYPDGIDPAALNVQATPSFGLEEILAREDGNYGFALGNEEPSSLIPAEIFETSNVDAWLDHLGAEAYDLPPLDSVDASGAHLFDATNQAELNNPPPDLAPIDSVSNIDGQADANDDWWDDLEIPYLPPYTTDPATGSSSINHQGPKTPTPIFAQPDFFADATYNIDTLDFENPTKFLLADYTASPDDEAAPLADMLKSTPVEDDKFQAMMTFLDTAAAEMFQQGMDVVQMLRCVETFTRGLKQKFPEKKESPQAKDQAPSAEPVVDLTDDEFDQARKILPAPTFSQILGEGFEF